MSQAVTTSTNCRPSLCLVPCGENHKLSLVTKTQPVMVVGFFLPESMGWGLRQRRTHAHPFIGSQDYRSRKSKLFDLVEL